MIKVKIVTWSIDTFIDRAIKGANFFIDRGFDAYGSVIESPVGYKNGAIANAIRKFNKNDGKVIVRCSNANQTNR